mgnify:CR=1 FL=1
MPFPWLAAATVASAGLGFLSARKGRRQAAAQSSKNLEFQKEIQAKLDEQKEVYKAMEFSNPYENLSNKFEGMQNAAEDLTVNTQSADYARKSFLQSQSNVLQDLRSSAGASGIAGLAQTLANTGLQQSGQMAAALGQQEAANKRLAVQEDSRIQQMIMGEDARIQMAKAGGAAATEQAERDRQATLLGMAQGQAAGANANVQAGYANQMAAQSANTQAMFGVSSGLISAGSLDKYIT